MQSETKLMAVLVIVLFFAFIEALIILKQDDIIEAVQESCIENNKQKACEIMHKLN